MPLPIPRVPDEDDLGNADADDDVDLPAPGYHDLEEALLTVDAHLCGRTVLAIGVDG